MTGEELIKFIQENNLGDYNFAMVCGDNVRRLTEDSFCIIDDGKDAFMVLQSKTNK